MNWDIHLFVTVDRIIFQHVFNKTADLLKQLTYTIDLSVLLLTLLTYLFYYLFLLLFIYLYTLFT